MSRGVVGVCSDIYFFFKKEIAAKPAAAFSYAHACIFREKKTNAVV
jgi:hypothetical protein